MCTILFFFRSIFTVSCRFYLVVGGSRNGQLQIAARGRAIKTSLEESVSVSRFALDAALVEHAIAAGSDFLGSALVRSCVLADSGDAVHVGTQAGEARLTSKIAVIANGLGSSLGANQNGRLHVADNSWLGAGVVFTDQELIVPPGTIWMTCGEGGYVGVVRVEDDQVAVAAALDPKLIETAGGIGNAVVRIFSDAKRDLFPLDWNRLDWRGTPLLTRQADSVAMKRIFAIGDATGYIEPFTGEGMGWAMQSAVALHPLVIKGVDRWDDDLSDQWSRDHRRLIVRHQRFCRFVAGWLRRPWAVSSAVTIFSVAPFLIRPLIARVQSAQWRRPCARKERDRALRSRD